jgi:DNA mismatch endonuclease (patch repair protein)
MKKPQISEDRTFATDPTTSARMRRVGQRNTAPEMAVRRALFSRGLRYRLQWIVQGCRSRPDIAFPKARVAIYIDGCFWHGCMRHRSRPKRNASSWSAKIEENRKRDLRVVTELAASGWRAFRYCASDNPEFIAVEIDRVLREQELLPGPVETRTV